ncbi:MAG TPA: endonuclease/exonuclease/phosphatase family protein [Candidatus Polarisedimenticolaceae bacterium]|nr:endonuclease/exonuclease/phosphatase family protein [Candidatus Polarisedimenticolaceae bacterium]
MGRAVLFGCGAASSVFLGLVWVGLPTAFPPPARGTGPTLRVAVANLAYDNDRALELTAVLRRIDPDVLVALEWTGSNLDLDTIAASERRIALDARRPAPHGVLVLTRRGLAGEVALAPSPVPGPCAMPVATLRLPRGDRFVSLLGVHAPPPLPECEATNEPTLRYLADQIDAGRLRRPIGAAATSDPLILAGDLNATPGSPGITRLRRGLLDAQRHRSWLPAGTWLPRDGPRLSFERIDYVLLAREIPLEGAWTVDLPGSDHRALVVDIGPLPGRDGER